jgi:hypothetical protein
MKSSASEWRQAKAAVGGFLMDSDEDEFWNRVVPAAISAGVERSQLGDLANRLDGDFRRAYRIALATSRARRPPAYLAAVLRKLRLGSDTAPAWVTEARTAYGYPVAREGKYWRMAGALYDDAGEQIGN